MLAAHPHPRATPTTRLVELPYPTGPLVGAVRDHLSLPGGKANCDRVTRIPSAPAQAVPALRADICFAAAPTFHQPLKRVKATIVMTT